ncbi:hypothetical protein GpartN1_g1442.t1 [Galdieria partita]|uniref:Uncharacterized protein n=1 Tax=Galdieria partita TaxID=83374 RepID=A0A9C7PSI8_9RHOD|nr:hypothetical protein GpartN1_g1442.t1 [Galdieria partita]
MSASEEDKTRGLETSQFKELLAERITTLESSQDTEEDKRIENKYKTAVKEGKALVESTDTTPESKLKTLLWKYLNKCAECKNLEYDVCRERQKSIVLERELEDICFEMKKLKAAKQKLETLSRELNKQNKTLAEESERRLKEEKERQAEIVKKFNEAMEEINSKIEYHSTKEAEMYKQKLEEKIEALHVLQEKYDLREEHFATQLGAKELEVELAKAKLREATEEFERKKEENNSQMKEFFSVVDTLQSKLAEYDKKCSQFEDALEQSSSVFKKYEDTIDRLSKTALSLKETNGDLKKQNEEACSQLTTLTSELEAAKKNEQKAKEKCECLEKLCRSLSTERSSLQKRIDEICTVWSVVENQISGLKTQVEDVGSGKILESLQKLKDKGELPEGEFVAMFEEFRRLNFQERFKLFSKLSLGVDQKTSKCENKPSKSSK